MTTPPANPVRLSIYGPTGGYTVDVRGATVYTDIEGDVATMPYSVAASVTSGVGVVEGIADFWVDHDRATGPLTLHVIVTCADGDGTILLDRTVTPPAVVDALARTVTTLDPFTER